MPKYEYRFELDLEPEMLNEVGNQAWELLAVSPTGKDNARTGFWFKRTKE